MASKKLAKNLERGLSWDKYFTKGLRMTWTEETEDEGLLVKSEVYESPAELEAAMRKVQPDMREWTLNPIKGSDDA